MSKIFVIFGATGQQGGALIRYLHGHAEFSSTYRLRGVTRDGSKPAAVKLKQEGVEIVEVSITAPVISTASWWYSCVLGRFG
jgi:uncharacterized protein YbjT (DUF2867 family)